MPLIITMLYSVFIGKKPGVYYSWDECKYQVNGYSGAKYKKCKTMQDAVYYSKHGYLKEDKETSNKAVHVMNFFTKSVPNTTIHIYTDGSALNNGSKDALAGYGVYFGDGDKRNLSEPLLNGKKTNNRAELSAIIAGINGCLSELDKGYRVIIHTDSEYCIKCYGKYGRKCESTQWKIKGEYVPNHDLIKIGLPYFRKYKWLELHHIKAHTNRKDIHSKGNHMADQLAVLGARKSGNKSSLF